MDLNKLAELYVSGFWVWLGLTIGIGGIGNYLFLIYNRTLRHWNIRKHGYPPGQFVDADGDVVHPKADKTA